MEKSVLLGCQASLHEAEHTRIDTVLRFSKATFKQSYNDSKGSILQLIDIVTGAKLAQNTPVPPS